MANPQADFEQGLDLEFMNVVVLDPDSTPNRVLDTDRAFRIRVDWKTIGQSVQTLGGDWHVRAYYESMGPGPEGFFAESVVPVSPVAPPATSESYSTLLGPASITTAGVYKIVVVLTHTNTNGSATELAAFGEGPLIQLRTP